MPLRLCLEAGCGELATTKGRCSLHAGKQDRSINRAGSAIYRTKRWKLLRKRVLFEQPLCACGSIARDCDHITAIEDGGEPYARANVQGLCASCHSVKTRREQMARAA